jgi:outer membrane protein assembly factor BamB
MIPKYGVRAVLCAVVCLLTGSVADAGDIFVTRVFSEFGTVDSNTGTYTHLGTTSVQINAMTFAPNGTLYGLGSDNTLYTVNTATGALTSVGSTGAFFTPIALAARSDGTLFAEDPFGSLYRLNATNGAATSVGSDSLIFVANGGLAFGPGNVLYADVSNTLYKVNQDTGAGTLVGPSGLSFTSGLFFADDQLDVFQFFGGLYTIDPETGAATPTGVTVTGGFGPVQAAVAAPVPEPSSLILFTIAAVIIPGGAWIHRRTRRCPARAGS